VATIIDLFPKQRARRHAVNAAGRIDWLRVVSVTALAAGVCVMAAAAVAARPQPAPLCREPAVAPALPSPAAAAPRIEAVSLDPVVIAPRRPGVREVLIGLNRAALVAQRQRRLPVAMESLARARQLCTRPAVAWDPLCARTHLNTGALLAGQGQDDLAVKHFRIARAIQHDISLPPRLIGAESVAAFAEALR